jgi:hypothetical protein
VSASDLWPIAVVLGLLALVSVWHDRNFRATIEAYAALRREAGATDEPWPAPVLRRSLALQPGLLLFGAILIAFVSLVGTLDELFRSDPLRWLPPGYNVPPPSASSIVAALLGWVAAAVLMALALYAARSPWKDVALNIRRAIYAKAESRERLFAEALRHDPGLVAPDSDRSADEAADAVVAL